MKNFDMSPLNKASLSFLGRFLLFYPQSRNCIRWQNPIVAGMWIKSLVW